MSGEPSCHVSQCMCILSLTLRLLHVTVCEYCYCQRYCRVTHACILSLTLRMSRDKYMCILSLTIRLSRVPVYVHTVTIRLSRVPIYVHNITDNTTVTCHSICAYCHWQYDCHVSQYMCILSLTMLLPRVTVYVRTVTNNATATCHSICAYCH